MPGVAESAVPGIPGTWTNGEMPGTQWLSCMLCPARRRYTALDCRLRSAGSLLMRVTPVPFGILVLILYPGIRS